MPIYSGTTPVLYPALGANQLNRIFVGNREIQWAGAHLVPSPTGVSIFYLHPPPVPPGASNLLLTRGRGWFSSTFPRIVDKGSLSRPPGDILAIISARTLVILMASRPGRKTPRYIIDGGRIRSTAFSAHPDTTGITLTGVMAQDGPVVDVYSAGSNPFGFHILDRRIQVQYTDGSVAWP